MVTNFKMDEIIDSNSHNPIFNTHSMLDSMLDSNAAHPRNKIISLNKESCKHVRYIILADMKMTIREFSHEAGISQKTLSSFFRGVTTLRTIERLRDFFLNFDLGGNDTGKNVRNFHWKLTTSEHVQHAITEVAATLTALYETINESNELGSPRSILGPLQKAQLIALLEAMLAALKAPAIDSKSAGGFFNWLGRIAKRGAEKGLEKGVSDSLGNAIDSGEKLLSELASQPSITDLDKLI